MKSPCGFFLFVFFLINSSASLAQEAKFPDKRSISVSGKAEKSVPADKVEIFGEIRIVKDSLKESQELSKSSFDGMASKLSELGVSAEQIELRNHRIGKNFETIDRKRVQKGFYSERSFLITLTDVSKLDLVSQELASVKDIAVSSTSFQRSDEIDIRKKLRIEALVAAKEKAEAMAAVYGQKVGLPLHIEENSGGGVFSPNFINTRNTFSTAEGSSANGRVTLSATVRTTFELQ